MSVVDIQTEIDELRLQLSKMYAKMEDYKQNPKVWLRASQLLGRQITKLNYVIGNKLVELDKALDDIKH